LKVNTSIKINLIENQASTSILGNRALKEFGDRVEL